MDRTLIANATIFDGTGSAPFSGDVLVEGQRVTAVQRANLGDENHRFLRVSG